MLNAEEKSSREALYGAFVQLLDTLDASPFEFPHPAILKPPSSRETLRDSYAARASYYASQNLVLAQIEDRIAASRQRLRRYEAGLMNALPPVAGLPFEILEEVFHYSNDADRNQGDTWAAVTRVCSDWRRCAKASRNIARSQVTRDIRRGLEHVGEDLYDLPEPVTKLTLYESQDYEPFPTDTLARVKHLTLDGLNQPLDILSQLGVLPNLETLDINSRGPNFETSDFDLSIAPKLSHVLLFPEKMTRFHSTEGVKHLTLQNCSFPNVEEFWDDTAELFLQFEAIVSLHVVAVEIEDYPEHDYEFDLPDGLEELTLSKMDPRSMIPFLDMAPGSETLSNLAISSWDSIDDVRFLLSFNYLASSRWSMISSLSVALWSMSESILQNLLPLSSSHRNQQIHDFLLRSNRDSVMSLPFPQLHHLTLESSLEPENPTTIQLIVEIVKERKAQGSPLTSLSVSRCLVEPASIPWLVNNVSHLHLRSRRDF